MLLIYSDLQRGVIVTDLFAEIGKSVCVSPFLGCIFFIGRQKYGFFQYEEQKILKNLL